MYVNMRHQLGIRGSSITASHRPHDSPHGTCVVCGRFMEVLDGSGQCRTEECLDVLRAMCEREGKTARMVVSRDVWIWLHASGIITRLEHWRERNDTHTNTPPPNPDMCGCGQLKRPRAAECATCYHRRLVEQYRARKAGSARARKGFTNRIKGL